MAGRKPPRRPKGQPGPKPGRQARGKPSRPAAPPRKSRQSRQSRQPRSSRAAAGPRQPSGPKGLGGTTLEGRHAVREALIAGTRRVTEITMAADLDRAPILDDIRDLARDQRVAVVEVSRTKLDHLARTEAPQGVVATARPLPEYELDDLASGDATPFLLIVDGVTDPGNLGSLLRSAECAGVTGVVLARHRSATLSPAAAKAAAGAIEHLRFAQVAGIPAAIQRLSSLGIWTVGLDAGGDTTIHDLAVSDGPVALVVGAEGTGVSKLSRQRCDVIASIPLRGSLDSLNAAAAAAVACFEIARHRT